MTNLRFKPIPADLAIDLYTGLVNARRTKLQPALNAAVKAVGVAAIDQDLQRLVPAGVLTHLASLGLRGERVFPVPAIIKHAPPLIGYYRMLLGLSQKEFGQSQRLGYAAWVNAERTGRLSPDLIGALDQFCSALINPLVQLVTVMNQFDDRDLSDLSLLTLGPTLQGGRNTVIGSRAAAEVFQALRSLVAPFTVFDSPRLIRFQTPSGRNFELIPASDPDIAIDEGIGKQTAPLIAIEIKGGKDISNAYNRAGEAEKSHISAKLRGYNHRWTIIHMSGLDRRRVCQKTPSSTEVFEAADIIQQSGGDWMKFQQKLKRIIGVGKLGNPA